MRKKEELKTVRKTVLMTEATDKDIEQEAAKRGSSANAVINERLNHPTSESSPAQVAKFQNFVNWVVKMMADYSLERAHLIEKEENKFWTF